MTLAERQKAEKQGRTAEKWGARLLRVKGYKILDMRYKCKWGEIDIIARHKDRLIAVEVKRRKTMEEAVAALQPYYQRRIEDSMESYQRERPALHDLDVRFDAIFVVEFCTIVHYRDAWRAY